MKKTQPSLNQLLKNSFNSNSSRTAVVHDNKKISYQELDKISDHVCNYFLKNKYAKGTVIAVHLNPSIDLIIILLGIIKAGCIYLPIDPKTPKLRKKQILKESRAACVISEQDVDIRFTLPTSSPKELQLSIEVNRLKRPLIDEKDGLYIIFTSGSTGKPKGTITLISGFTSTINARLEQYQNYINSLLISSINFDMSIMTIFQSILSGGKLVIPNQDRILDFQYLYEVIQNNHINFLLLVPSFYKQLLKICTLPPVVNTVVLAGEALDSDIVSTHAKINPEILLYVEYGLSECSICSTIGKIYPIKSKNILDATWVGNPLDNTNIHVVDESNSIVKNSTKGEICISGSGLANGYINDVLETKKRFTEIFVTETKKVKVFKTGDIGYKDCDNNLFFCGRKDNQVKINGFRIELEEIEKTICIHPNVIDCVVIPTTTNNYSKCLLAYFTSKEDSINGSDILNFLKKHLPEYMIPTKIMNVKSIPTTQNGKKDRTCVIDKNNNSRVQQDEADSPEKQALIGILLKNLNIKHVNASDSFFEIGGDSLSAISFLLEINEHFSCDLSFIDLKNNPTIEALANLITKRKKEQNKNQNTIKKNVKPKFRKLKCK